MGEMIAFAPREIQIFSKGSSDNTKKEEKEGQKVEEKVDLSIELQQSRQALHGEKVARPEENEKMTVMDDGSEYCEIESQKVDKKVESPIELGKTRQELHREEVVSPKGNENIIAVDDGFEYCETEGRKMENKDQGGIKRSKEKPLRIKELITTEDGSAICEKMLKQIAMCDPDNTRQISNGSPQRRIKDYTCITDPEHILNKNVGERGSYKQRKEDQSRKQYSLRSNAKEQTQGVQQYQACQAENQPQQWKQMKSLCVPSQLAPV